MTCRAFALGSDLTASESSGSKTIPTVDHTKQIWQTGPHIWTSIQTKRGLPLRFLPCRFANFLICKVRPINDEIHPGASYSCRVFVLRTAEAVVPESESRLLHHPHLTSLVDSSQGKRTKGRQRRGHGSACARRATTIGFKCNDARARARV